MRRGRRNDEVIYPVDFKQAGHIVDDEMHAIMVHSSTRCALDGHFDLATQLSSRFALHLLHSGCTQGTNLAKEAGMGLINVIGALVL